MRRARQSFLIIASLYWLSCVTPQPKPASPVKTTPSAAANATAVPSKPPPLPMTVRNGMFPVVERDHKVLLAVPRSLLKQELLLHVELLQGFANEDTSPGIGLESDNANDIVVTLEQRRQSLLLMHRQLRLYSGNDPMLTAALQSSSSDSLIASAKIEELPPGEGPRDAILVDPGALLLGSGIQIDQLLETALRSGTDTAEVELRPKDSQIERMVPQHDGVIIYTRQTFNIKKSTVVVHGIPEKRGVSVQGRLQPHGAAEGADGAARGG